ncbi:MAG: ABC transporter permease [Streptosporangiaceae bacterium]
MTRIESPTRRAADRYGLAPPGRGGGLLEVVRHRYLLHLLVRKDLKVRYQGSVLGMGWSYIKPAIRFGVYFFIIGMVLGLRKSVPNFPVYIFCGLSIITFFNEMFNSTTRSIRSNKALIRKVYVPREMFPVASVLVSAVHFFPQLAILLVAAAITGWVPSFTAVGAAVLGFAIVAALGMGVGLLFSACNVFFRDFEKIVDVLNIVIRWSAPMIYPFHLVYEALGGGWPLQVYLANPLVSSVSLFQRAFWFPTIQGGHQFPPHLFLRGLAELGACLLLIGVAQVVFSRLETRFAEAL